MRPWRRREKGRTIALDADARSADPSLPGILARPSDAPVYHGFTILDDVEIDGFRLGIITDIGPGQDDVGDAFVIAPDNSRCGVVWELVDEPDFHQVIPPEPNRWGVWGVGFILIRAAALRARMSRESRRVDACGS